MARKKISFGRALSSNLQRKATNKAVSTLYQYMWNEKPHSKKKDKDKK